MHKIIPKTAIALFLGLICHTAQADQQVCNENLRPSTPTARFIDNADGTVTDASSGLMWSKCDLGQQWLVSESICTGAAQPLMWEEALDQITQQNAGGPLYADWSDWRMPNIKELLSIVEWSCTAPGINTTVFELSPDDQSYWSSTPVTSMDNDDPQAWYFDFQESERQAPGSMDWPMKVRLVRDTSIP